MQQPQKIQPKIKWDMYISFYFWSHFISQFIFHVRICLINKITRFAHCRLRNPTCWYATTIYFVTFAPPSEIYHRTCFWKILSIWLVKLCVWYFEWWYFYVNLGMFTRVTSMIAIRAYIFQIYDVNSKEGTCKSYMCYANQIWLTKIKCS